MTPSDRLKHSLIDKIRMIEDEDFLKALDNLVSAANPEETIQLSPAQEELLQMSESDIKAGRLISQEELDKLDQEWLKER
jgi:hypothetical protein